MSNWPELSRLANDSAQLAFGTLISYQPAAGGGAFSVVGIADRTSDEQMQADGVYLRLFVHLADFSAAPEQCDEATIDGTVYRVFDVRVDTAGGAWLSLRAAG
jgi:hypothetical protein